MQHPVREYFSFNVDDNKSACLINGCNIKLTGNHAANLTRHLQYNHPNEYTLVTMSKERRKRRSGEEYPSASTSTSASASNKNAKVLGTEMTGEYIVNACIELVTKNGRPLSILHDSGFRKILDPVLEILPSPVTINENNIRDAIFNNAMKLKNKIKIEVKNKLVSLKIDGATRHLRSFMGINIQYILNGKIVIRTLALKEMFGRHTSSNIKDLVINVLKEYDLTVNNIYSVTTDNGSNMIKLIKLLEEECDHFYDVSNFSETDTDHTFLDKYHDQFYLEGETFFSTEENNVQLIGVRCVAHTLQLAVQDALKMCNVQELLQKTREIVKKLRTPSIGILIKTMKLQKPILDCTTRWNSTFNMLERLLHLKDVCTELYDITLSEDDWGNIKQLLVALEPAKIATKKMQYEQLTMGDFYAIWLQCNFSLKRMEDNHFAKILFEAIHNREYEILSNKSLLASILLDPRYKSLLSEQQKDIATVHLMNTWKRYERLNCIANNQITPKQSPSTSTDDIEKLLVEKDTDLYKNQHKVISTFNVATALNAFSQTSRIDKKENIIEYWQKHGLPELRELANVVHAAPPTQVSVERLFSGLKFILNDNRARLNYDILEHIMILRTNTFSNE